MKFGSIEIIDNNGWNLNDVIRMGLESRRIKFKNTPNLALVLKPVTMVRFYIKHVFNETPVVKLTVTSCESISAITSIIMVHFKSVFLKWKRQ